MRTKWLTPVVFLFPFDYPYYTGNSSMMRKVIGIFLLSALMCGPAALTGPLAEMNDASETIQYLLAFVKNSECRFFRNDKEHTAGEAGCMRFAKQACHDFGR